MTSPLASLVDSGTKLWLDSVDPDLIAVNRSLGATGATSNPIIISNLIKSGRYDENLRALLQQPESTDSDVAWSITDQIVSNAEQEFLPIWQSTRGNDGYVSFEVDPLLEDPILDLPHEARVESYRQLGKKWSTDHPNRMIKVPATPSGLEALEYLASEGVPLNITLIFSLRQYREARDSVWRGAQQLKSLENFKSVYSVFVSRVDVYTEKHVSQLSAKAQGEVGILNAKQMWLENQDFWSDKSTPLEQEMIFASTGTKKPEDPPWKYVAALAGSDIQTNPPETNDAVEKSGRTIVRTVDQLPDEDVIQEISSRVDQQHLEAVLMEEGIKKFAEPQKALLALIEAERVKATG